MKLRALLKNVRRRQSGLTLVEILVASALLLFISLGLTAMFSQAQRAFKGGLKQVNVLEAGRAAFEVVVRDFSMAKASETPGTINLFAGTRGRSLNDLPVADPNVLLRTNYLQDLFLMTHDTQWQGIGYRVLQPVDPTSNPTTNTFVGVGTLYRFSTNSHLVDTNRFFDTFLQTPLRTLLGIGSPPNPNPAMRKIIDGVVHFRVTLFDAAGKKITNNVPDQIEVFPVVAYDNELVSVFRGSALPVMVEIELGVLEPTAYETLKPILAIAATKPDGGDPAVTAARDFIKRNGGRIHIFRQQIPIRPART